MHTCQGLCIIHVQIEVSFLSPSVRNLCETTHVDTFSSRIILHSYNLQMRVHIIRHKYTYRYSLLHKTSALTNKQAKHPLDWLTNFLMHANTSLLYLILIQYCLAVYSWSAVQAAGAVLSIGVCLGLFAPVLLHRYVCMYVCENICLLCIAICMYIVYIPDHILQV